MASVINASTSAGLVQTADTSGVLQLQTNSGTAALTIDTSQNVGIGTTSPAAKLDVTGSTGSLKRAVLVTPSSESAAIDALRTVAIQRVSNDTQLAIGYATTPDAWVISSSYGTTGAYKPLAFATSDTERMRIDSSGRVCINNTTSPGGQPLYVKALAGVGSAGLQVSANGSGAIDWYNASATYVASVIVNASAVAYNTTSDYRLKDNIVPMTGALDKILQLNPVTYTWKQDGSDGQGFIAHELQAIVPDCVSGEKDAVDAEGNPKYQGVDTSFLVATLTAAIQEMKAIIDAQSVTINDLTARITALEGAA